jgi:hypothetical protein
MRSESWNNEIRKGSCCEANKFPGQGMNTKNQATTENSVLYATLAEAIQRGFAAVQRHCQSREAVKYVREFQGSRNQECLCRRGAAAIYSSTKVQPVFSCIVRCRYLATSSEHSEDFMHSCSNLRSVN